MQALHSLDPFLAVQRFLASPPLDGVMVAISTAGEGWVLAILAAVAILWLERDRRTALRVAAALALALLVDGVVVQLLKQVLDAPRPVALLGDEVRVLGPVLRRHSMPSGHASAAAVLASFLLARAPRGDRGAAWAAGVAALLALAVGVARVYVGAHWVFDVIVGWAIGASIGLLAARRSRRVATAGASPEPAPA